MLALCVVYVCVLQYPRFTSFAPQWGRLGIPVASVSFADMRSITTGWECTRRGVDVLARNPCDPSQRPANYPRLWMDLAFVGLGDEQTTELAVGAGLVFVLSVFVLAGPITPFQGVVWASLLLSPAVMLGVERGNADILVFVLLVLALVAFRRGGPWSVSSFGLFLVAGLLKLFPALAAGAFLHQKPRRALLGTGALVAGFGIYGLVTLDDLRVIRRVVPREIEVSYGAGVLVDYARETFGPDSILDDRTLAVATLCAIGLLAGLGFALVTKRSATRFRGLPPASENQFELAAFWAGAGIYLGTYSITENNYDYRLGFLLLTIPQLLRWATCPEAPVPFARGALVLIGMTLWLSLFLPLPFGLDDRWSDLLSRFPVDEILNWLLFVYLAGALMLALPSWLRKLQQRPALPPGELPRARRDYHPPG